MTKESELYSVGNEEPLKVWGVWHYKFYRKIRLTSRLKWRITESRELNL